VDEAVERPAGGGREEVVRVRQRGGREKAVGLRGGGWEGRRGACGGPVDVAAAVKGVEAEVQSDVEE